MDGISLLNNARKFNYLRRLILSRQPPPRSMSCLVWNCRGLGNLRIKKELGAIVRAKDPSVMFIAKTWVDEVRLKDIKRNLEFDHVFLVPRINRGGGLALF